MRSTAFFVTFMIAAHAQLSFAQQSSPNFVPNIPDECRRIGICENVPDYPEEYVSRIIKNIGNATDRFRVDVLNREISEKDPSPDEIALCKYSKQIIIPRAAMDERGNWHYIVNTKGTVQLHVETCTEPDTPCSSIAHFPTGYTSSCKQKHVIRSMTTLDKDGNVVEKDVTIPSACCCVVHMDDSRAQTTRIARFK